MVSFFYTDKLSKNYYLFFFYKSNELTFLISFTILEMAVLSERRGVMEFVENVCEKEYTEFVINHPKSHFLESYEWGEVSKLRGLIPHYVGLKDNKHLVGTALIL